MPYKRCSILNGEYLSPDCSQLDKTTGQANNKPCTKWDALVGNCWRQATALEQSGGWLGQISSLLWAIAIIAIIIAIFYFGRQLWPVLTSLGKVLK